LQQLDGVTAPATAWESDILPARLPNYDPAWLDQLCISGQICWGRLLRPREGNGKSGPVKSTPLNLVQRSNVDLWQTLAGSAAAPTLITARPQLQPLVPRSRDFTTQQPTEHEHDIPLSSGAALLQDILQKQGAMFF